MEKKARGLQLYRNQTHGFPLSSGMKCFPVDAGVMPLFMEPEEGHFDVSRDHGQEADVETSVGIGGACGDRKRHCPEERLLHSLLSSFGLSGSFPPPGWCELDFAPGFPTDQWCDSGQVNLTCWAIISCLWNDSCHHVPGKMWRMASDKVDKKVVLIGILANAFFPCWLHVLSPLSELYVLYILLVETVISLGEYPFNIF